MISMRYYNNNKDKRNWVLGLPHKDLFIGSQSLISYTRWYRCSLDLTKGISFPYSYQLSSIGVPRTFVLLLLSPRYTDNRFLELTSRISGIDKTSVPSILKYTKLTDRWKNQEMRKWRTITRSLIDTYMDVVKTFGNITKEATNHSGMTWRSSNAFSFKGFLQ